METTMNDSVQILKCIDEHFSTPSYFQTIIFIVLSIITVSLNMLLIVVVLITEKLRKTTNYIIVSMTGADLLVGLVSEPIWALVLWVDGNTYLTVAKFVVHFSLMSSVTHLLVLTLERTIAVLKPLHYRAWVTRAKLRITIACAWLWSLFAASLQFIWFGYSYYLFLVWTGFIVFVIVAVLNCVLLLSLKNYTNALRAFSSTECPAVRNAKRREGRKTILVAIFTLLFAICVLPTVFSETLCYTNVITQKTKNFINLLFFLYPIINPIIFMIREKKFRSAVKPKTLYVRLGSLVKRICGCDTPQPITANGSRGNLRLHSTRSDTSEIYYESIRMYSL